MCRLPPVDRAVGHTEECSDVGVGRAEFAQPASLIGETRFILAWAAFAGGRLEGVARLLRPDANASDFTRPRSLCGAGPFPLSRHSPNPLRPVVARQATDRTFHAGIWILGNVAECLII